MTNYNNVKYIYKAIDSIRNQTISVDLMVVDDGSTDNSVDMIQNYNKNISGHKDISYYHNDIQLIVKTNGGPSSARNAGLEKIVDNYEYILLLDSDDYIKPTFAEKCIDAIKQDDRIIGAYSDYNILVNEENIEPFEVREYKRSITLNGMWQECLMPHLAVIKSSAYKAVYNKFGYYYDESLRVCNDYDMDLKLCQFGIIWHIPEALSVVREGINNSCSPIQGEIRQQCYQKVMENNAEFYLSR